MGAEEDRLSELDYLYNMTDKLYAQFARTCGLSSCAYWMMYDLERAGGTVPLRQLCDSWSYSKQTINSALKSLEARDLIALDFRPGSRKNKVASLTAAGRAFSASKIVPAMEAERRAFGRLGEDEREQLLRLARAYATALDAEITGMIADACRDSDGADGAEPARDMRKEAR